MSIEDAAAAIERLRAARVFRAKNQSIVGIIERERAHADRVHRRLGELITLWQELAPSSIVQRTALVGLRAGVLSVEAESAAIGYELDQALRDGLLTELRRRCRGTLTRVRVRVAAIRDEHR